MSHNYLVEDVFKGVDNTAKRLFNHRPFTEGEIRCFISAFEERNPTEKHSEILENTAERVNDINSNLFPKLSTVSCDNYKDLIDKIGNIERSMEDVLKIEASKAEERKDKVEQFIREENEKLVIYMKDMEKRMDAIDEEYGEKRLAIEKEFTAKN